MEAIAEFYSYVKLHASRHADLTSQDIIKFNHARASSISTVLHIIFGERGLALTSRKSDHDPYASIL
jgi:hypothetical protein